MVRGKFLSHEDDLSAVLDIRRRIFCDELGESEQSVFDGSDDFAMHAVVFGENDSPAAIGRAVMLGSVCKLSFIGVLKEYRKKEYGDFIVRMLCDRAFACNAARVTVDARANAVGFYEHIGFEKTGEPCGERQQMQLDKEDFVSPCQKCAGKINR